MAVTKLMSTHVQSQRVATSLSPLCGNTMVRTDVCLIPPSYSKEEETKTEDILCYVTHLASFYYNFARI